MIEGEVEDRRFERGEGRQGACVEAGTEEMRDERGEGGVKAEEEHLEFECGCGREREMSRGGSAGLER